VLIDRCALLGRCVRCLVGVCCLVGCACCLVGVCVSLNRGVC